MVHPLQTFRERQSPPLTRMALASMLDVSPATVTRWESGQRLPDAEMLPRISKCTGIPARELRPDLAKLLCDE